MPTLRFSRAGAVETEVPLGAVDLRVGRSADNDVILKDPDKTLSRHHAEIRRDGEAWVYLDLNSANGSWVGDRSVTRELLQPGVTIGLGDYEVTFVRDAGLAADRDDEATRVMRDVDDTLRPGAVAAPVPGRQSAAGVVGGAVPKGAPPPPHQPASSPVFRRIIIYGSIFVFGAFGVMLALILRPDPEAIEQPAAAVAAAPPAPPAPAAAPPSAAAPAPSVVPPPGEAAALTPPPAPVTAAPASTPAAPAARPAPRQSAAAARPTRDTDADAGTIPIRSGETPYAVRQRRDDIRRRYQLGLQHLTARRFVEARDTLAGVFADAPRFRDVREKLAEATAGIRQAATEGLREAARHEAAEEWTEAIRRYESLRPYADALPTLAEATDRSRRRMHEAGVNALSRARQYDSQGRLPEAAAWYKRAVEWLPPDHAGQAEARARLAQLGNRP